MLPSKWENLSCCSTKLIHVCKKLAGITNILIKYIIYIFFNFGCGFCSLFPMLFLKAPVSCCNKFLNYFLLHGTSIFMSSRTVSRIFKILFQTGDINIFVLCGVFFSKYVQVKSSFSGKKNISVEIWETL